MVRYLVILMVLAQFIFSPQEVHGSQARETSLYKSLFYNEIYEYSPARLDVSQFPKELQSRLVKYMERAKTFHSKLKQPNGSVRNKMWHSKLVQVEKGIIMLIDAEEIEEAAAAYVKSAKIYLEWEGMSDGPIEEALYAENYLKKNPGTPIKPYLLLFLIHRYRISFECLDSEKKDERRDEAASKYQDYLEIAQAEKDPLVRAIADDINKQSYLYIETRKRP